MNRWQRRWPVAVVFCLMFWGCSGNQGLRHRPASPPPAQTGGIRPPLPEISDWGWRERLITEDELNQLELADPNLNPSATHRILARLNGKADYYIYEDIRKSRPLRVPNDFRAYSGWTPLPRQTDHLAHLSKAILVVKDFPFIGWYEHGKLAGDSLVSLGRPGEETEAGVYQILDKAADKYSLSYRNDFGEPAWMPWAMRIYSTVWIHAGDIAGPYCSHGCVMLPMDPAEHLFHWSDDKTVVVIVDSLAHLNQPPKVKVKSARK